MPGVRHFFTKVVGVTYLNRDGTSRQEAIACMQPGEWLSLEYEPDNPYSDHAVAVFRQSGHQIGYVPDDLAEALLQSVRAGKTFQCCAADVTGGRGRKRALGVNLLLIVVDTDTAVSADDLGRYAGGVLSGMPLYFVPSGERFDVVDDTADTPDTDFAVDASPVVVATLARPPKRVSFIRRWILRPLCKFLLS